MNFSILELQCLSILISQRMVVIKEQLRFWDSEIHRIELDALEVTHNKIQQLPIWELN